MSSVFNDLNYSYVQGNSNKHYSDQSVKQNVYRRVDGCLQQAKNKKLSITGKRIGRPKIDRENTRCVECCTSTTPQWRYLSLDDYFICVKAIANRATPDTGNIFGPSDLHNVNANVEPSPPCSILCVSRVAFCNACWLRIHKVKQKLQETYNVSINSSTSRSRSRKNLSKSLLAPTTQQLTGPTVQTRPSYVYKDFDVLSPSECKSVCKKLYSTAYTNHAQYISNPNDTATNNNSTLLHQPSSQSQQSQSQQQLQNTHHATGQSYSAAAVLHSKYNSAPNSSPKETILTRISLEQPQIYINSAANDNNKAAANSLKLDTCQPTGSYSLDCQMGQQQHMHHQAATQYHAAGQMLPHMQQTISASIYPVSSQNLYQKIISNDERSHWHQSACLPTSSSPSTSPSSGIMKYSAAPQTAHLTSQSSPILSTDTTSQPALSVSSSHTLLSSQPNSPSNLRSYSTLNNDMKFQYDDTINVVSYEQPKKSFQFVPVLLIPTVEKNRSQLLQNNVNYSSLTKVSNIDY